MYIYWYQNTNCTDIYTDTTSIYTGIFIPNTYTGTTNIHNATIQLVYIGIYFNLLNKMVVKVVLTALYFGLYLEIFLSVCMYNKS